MWKFPLVYTTANMYTWNGFVIQNPRNPSNYTSRLIIRVTYYEPSLNQNESKVYSIVDL